MIERMPNQRAERVSPRGRAVASMLAFCAFLGYTAADGAFAEASAYRVVIEGVSDAKLRTTLERISDTIARQAEPPVSQIQLRRRAGRDVERLLKVLRARGHYGARIEVDIDGAPPVVTFRILQGPVYVLKQVTVEVSGGEEDGALSPPGEETLGLTIGAPAEAKAIVQAQSILERMAQDQGYPFAAVEDREVIVDHADQGASVTFTLQTGPRATLGPLTTEGLGSVHESFVTDQIPWQEGDSYSASALDELRKRLQESGLFSLIEVKPVDPVDSEGHVPIHVRLVERKHRTIAAGLMYETDTGAGARFSWEHRNLDGLGRKLTLEGEVSEIQHGLDAAYRLPRFEQPSQSLLLRFRAAEESPDSYTSTYAGVSAWVERKVNAQLTLGAGLALRVDDVEQQDEQRTYKLLSTPIQMVLDTTEAPLNPVNGFRLTARGEPFLSFDDGGAAFLKGEVSFSHYIALAPPGDWILAGRLKLGSIMGASQDDVPADERFYAGGGGSIRGYAYQRVGPLDEDDDPVGGRSLAEVAIELRKRMAKRLGVVGFIDGGTAFDSAWPDFDETVRWGAGLGARYFTPFGPLRLDVAVPLNPRKDDDPVQVYVSLGQAF